MFESISEAQNERSNISWSHLAGGTVGGFVIGVILTLFATVMFFKVRQSQSGASCNLVSFLYHNLVYDILLTVLLKVLTKICVLFPIT